MSDEITVDEYKVGDEKQIIPLLQDVYGDWPRIDLECSALEHWKWKYLENNLGKILVVVAKHSERVVGTGQLYIVPVKVCGEIIHWGYAGDMAVHPDYRRMGISNRLLKLSMKLRLERDTPCTYFVTRNPHIIKSYTGKLPEFPVSVSVLVQVKDIDKQLNAIAVDHPNIMKIGYTVVKQLQDMRNIVRGSQAKTDVEVVKIDSFKQEIDAFWEKVKNDYDFIVERREGYLNWRYCDKRGGDFDVNLAKDGSEIIGYCVNRINRYREDYPVGFVVDLITLKGREDAADALLSNAQKYFDSNDVNTVLAACINKHPMWSKFLGQGFVDTRINFKLFYNSPEKKLECLEDSDLKAHFMFGDIDSLPVEVSMRT